MKVIIYEKVLSELSVHVCLVFLMPYLTWLFLLVKVKCVVSTMAEIIPIFSVCEYCLRQNAFMTELKDSLVSKLITIAASLQMIEYPFPMYRPSSIFQAHSNTTAIYTYTYRPKLISSCINLPNWLGLYNTPTASL